VLAQKIVEDLEAALEQFREIATDLGGKGFITLLTSLVCGILVDFVMFIRVLRSRPPKEIVLGESISELLFSGLVRDYMRLLGDARALPGRFDHFIYDLHRLCGWCVALGLFLVAVGLISAQKGGRESFTLANDRGSGFAKEWKRHRS
jgi:hypothetical protein